MIFLALCSVGLSGFGILQFNGHEFVRIVVVFSCVLWVFDAIAQVCSVACQNPLLGMLVFLNWWFTTYLFAGWFLVESQIIWPFRGLCYLGPLK
jgi:hypothetical protein